jgi:hypothetical protein
MSPEEYARWVESRDKGPRGRDGSGRGT